MVIEQLPLDLIIAEAAKLPLKEALAFAVAKGVVSFSGKGLGKLKKLIQDKQNEGRYAFVPNKEEANLMKVYGKDPEYIQLFSLVPKYKHIDLFRTGLLLKHHYSVKKDNPRVKAIKEQILRRPNGFELLKITQLAAQPVFGLVLEYLEDLKKRGYPEHVLEDVLEEFVIDWRTHSRFFRSDEIQKTITEFCKNQVKKNVSVFFLMGMKSAATNVEKVIDKLTKNKYFEKHNYDVTTKKMGQQLRVEVTVTKKD